MPTMAMCEKKAVFKIIDRLTLQQLTSFFTDGDVLLMTPEICYPPCRNIIIYLNVFHLGRVRVGRGAFFFLVVELYM